MNKCTLIGRIASVKVVAGDVLTYQIVTDDPYKDKNGNWQSRVSNFFVTMFGRRAQALRDSNFLRKGHLVSVEATIRSTSYVVDGRTVYGYDFIIEDIQLLSRTLDEMIENRDRYRGSGHVDHIPDVNHIGDVNHIPEFVDSPF